MSTKTTLKRIALVAVSALGFGVMTAIAPASAAATALTAGTSSPARVGAKSSTAISVTTNGSGTFTAAAKITAAPTGSTLLTETNTATKGVYISGSATSSNAGGLGSATATVTPASATAAAFTVDFTADLPGTYTILVSANNSAFTAGDPSVAITITTVGAPTTIALASVAGQVVGSGTKGQLMSMSLKDANGLATVLAPNEAITLSESDTTVEVVGLADSADGSDSSSYSIGVNSANLVAGVYYFRVVEAATVAAGSTVITATGGGLLPSTLQVSASATKIAASTATTDRVACTTSTNCVNVTGATTTAYAAEVKGAVGVTVSSLTAAGASGANYVALVVDNAKAITYDTYYSSAAAATTATFTMPAPSTGKTVAVDFGATTATFTFAAASATSLVVQGSDSVLSATGGANKFVVLVRDQYTAAMANVAVSVAVSGRNTVATRAIGVSDANGLVTYTLTDAGTTGTVDTLTFTGAGSVTAKVTYGTVTVGSVAVTGGSTVADAGVEGANTTAISAAAAGPHGNAKDITATVKDANGNLLAGVPVTFTVSSGAIQKTAAIDYSLVYTGTDGKAVTKVLGWVPGKQTITATAGGKSGSDYLTWAATDASSARVLTATAAGNVVSVKVVDRYGNGVAGVTVSLSREGTGFFGSGKSTDTVTTDKFGTADIAFNGDAKVTAELDTATYTQSADLAGEVNAVAVTAAVAGTTIGTGASLAPAGVNKASVSVALGTDAAAVAAAAAADAAAEAIDAANAATDAANLAAEAADAATVAAEEARDAADAATAAVEELATQVATLMAALKAQITTLANTVAKIAKKVRA